MALAFIPALVTGCIDNPEDNPVVEHFKELTALGMHGESSGIYLYEEGVSQYAVSSAYNTTRILNDDKSKYVAITMAAAPQAGQDVETSVTTYGISGSGTADKSLSVLKIADSKVWLMDDEAKVCYIMPWVK